RYKITAVNTGPDAAEGVVVTDELPRGVSYQSSSTDTGSISNSSGTVTWKVGSLAVGASATATITVKVDAGSGTITNTAREAQSTPDPTGKQVASVQITPSPK